MLFVRRLKVPDLPALEAIEAHHVAHLPSRPSWMSGFRRLVEVTLDEEPEGLMIAELDGTVVGWTVARQRGVHPMSGLRYGHIFHLSVSPAHLGKGVGTRLMREAEAYLRTRGCQSIQLSMPAEHPAAAELFKRSGYKLMAWELEKSFVKG